jgi:hypothetical protein
LAGRIAPLGLAHLVDDRGRTLKVRELDELGPGSQGEPVDEAASTIGQKNDGGKPGERFLADNRLSCAAAGSELATQNPPGRLRSLRKVSTYTR